MNPNRISSFLHSSITTKALMATLMFAFADKVSAQMPRVDHTQTSPLRVEVKDLGMFPIGEGKIGVTNHSKKLKDVDWAKLLVKAKGGADCVDWRYHVDKPDWQDEGPNIAGWVVALIAMSNIMGQPLPLDEALMILKKSGFKWGAHIDGMHSSNWHAPQLASNGQGTGCGANDKMVPALELIKNKSNELKPVVMNILWSAFNEEIYNKLVGSTIIPESHNPRELLKTLQKRCSPEDIDVLDSWHDHHDITHKHRERGIGLWLVKGYTVSEEKLRQIEEDFQVFWVDVWLFPEIALNMYPDENDADKRSEVIHSLTMYHVAVVDMLTKQGTQELVSVSAKK